MSTILPYLAIRGARLGSLFVLEDGSYLTRQRFATTVSSALKLARVNDKLYTTHSFQIGAATSAKEAGVSDVHIKMLCRWKSNTYQLYVRTPCKHLAILSSSIVTFAFLWHLILRGTIMASKINLQASNYSYCN